MQNVGETSWPSLHLVILMLKTISIIILKNIFIYYFKTFLDVENSNVLVQMAIVSKRGLFLSNLRTLYAFGPSLSQAVCRP